MNKYLAVFSSDTKNTFRDPSLIMVLCTPLLIVLILKFGFPLLLKYVPQADAYLKEIISFFVLLSATLPGIIMSFILLDEKDMHLFPVVKVTPASLSGFLVTRLFVMVFTGFFMSLLVLLLNGAYVIPLTKSVMVALLAGLNSPVLALLVSFLAKNKVEGLALMKVAMITLFIPMAVFFIKGDWEYIMGIFPAFWVYKFFDVQNSFIFFAAALIFLVLFNSIIFKAVCARLK